MHSTLAQPPPVPVPASRSRLSLLLLAASLAWLWFSLCRQLSYEWSANEQYNYGWFVPFFAAFLFWLRFEDAGRLRSGYSLLVNGYPAEIPASAGIPNNQQRLANNGAALAAITFLVALAPLRLFEIANPDWRPLSWLHAFIVVGLTLLLLHSLGGKTALRHFAFPVCFILVAVPWITPIETPVVQGLMRLVAAIATETLTLFGIPASLEGSLIRVSNGVVGVSEACSGVRSLQTSLMVGLLFGELKRLSLGKRIALVAAALAIAFVANCARAFFLVWIAATQNLAAVARWHDLAGYAIVGAVFLGTIAIASRLAKGRSEKEEGRKSERSVPHLATGDPQFPFLPSSFIILTFSWLLLTEASVSAWYLWHERNFVPTRAWTAHWPENAPGFRDLPIDDNVRSTLRYDSGREGAWRIALTNSPNDSAPPPASCTMFFFRWKPGSASILRARAHRPDICLPNTGWRATADDGVRSYKVAPDFALPFRHFRFARDVREGRKLFAQAFFCQREDRVPARAPDRFDATSGTTGNWMRGDRLRVVREGLRNQGQQVLEVVLIAPNELGRVEAEAEFGRLIPRLVKEEVGRKKEE